MELKMVYSISKLAKEFGLSRSTLLYYDSIGLLCTDERTSSDYRIYTDKHHERLKRICQLRSTGLSLKEIAAILKQGNSQRADLLHQRLNAINDEINKLRNQQKIIVELLANRKLYKGTKVVTKEMWVGFLQAAGLDDQGMWLWHKQFENTAPQAHEDFLESLGLSENEIKGIREKSRHYCLRRQSRRNLRLETRNKAKEI